MTEFSGESSPSHSVFNVKSLKEQIRCNNLVEMVRQHLASAELFDPVQLTDKRLWSQNPDVNVACYELDLNRMTKTQVRRKR